MLSKEKLLVILTWAARIGLALSLLAVLAELLGGPGHRMHWWDFRFGLSLMKWGGLLSILGIIASLFGLIAGFYKGHARVLRPAVAGLLMGAAVFTVTFRFKRAAESVPRIHDVTTDVQNPPLFTAILPLRAGVMNSTEYGGPDVAKQQIEAYPDIRPKTLSLTQKEAFDRALETAKGMGWEIVIADRNDNRIEATDTTLWFGFKDDVVIRLKPTADGTRVDVRSVSRVGISDLGANARRIRTYLSRLD